MWGHHLIVHKVNMFCICIFLKAEDSEWGVTLFLGKIGIYHTSEFILAWNEHKILGRKSNYLGDSHRQKDNNIMGKKNLIQNM